MEDFDRLAEQYRPLILSVLRNLNIYQNREDFFQIGLIHLWQAYLNYKPEKGNFSAYAYITVRRGIVRELKKWKRKEGIEHDVDENYWNSVKEEPKAAEMAFIKDAVCRLPESEREFVIRHFIWGYSLREIAEMENSAYATVKLKKKRALEKLRKALTDK
ncbi:sigma-70 family RNA polymerase sigma factor [Caldibacillus debilis]|jgi:DNA-directed RNA polymerase|uniref:RNA polymerase sigma factor, sigma-70 family n=1 Tax=Caldibacillus debilis GB1 TaxID=1339248 RepID=A0A420VJM4_9BACI|nr:sigma-70 family RNA polymerase sigma factor [Caldibacillus debilis]MBO2480606.1 RNA polymerase subunit sigma-24 [Bacillaceae bacterium]RKO63805.1 RNA polymerase sigma factor, sigma-70 family [Caldibacillus debilis GB1]